MDDVLRDLPILRPLHPVAEPRETRFVPGVFEPFVEPALRLEREVERGGISVLRASGCSSACEEPFGKGGMGARRLVRPTIHDAAGEMKDELRRGDWAYIIAVYAAMPSVPSYFVRGLPGSGTGGQMGLRSEEDMTDARSFDLLRRLPGVEEGREAIVREDVRLDFAQPVVRRKQSQ